jgi:hypothetical protein
MERLLTPGQRKAKIVVGDEPDEAALHGVHLSSPDPVLLFSQGEISRKQAMRQLGITYGELLDFVADRSLPLPRVSDEETDRMADMMVALLDRYTR